MPSISSEMSEFLEEFITPSEQDQLTRSTVQVPSEYQNKDTFTLEFNNRLYGKQYASIYFNRLNLLRRRILPNALKKWGNEVINGKKVVKKDKVLDIKSDEPAWVIGTVYCEMKYKTNILEEVSKGISGAESPKTYTHPDLDEIMLEDESGRIFLEGDLLKKTLLVTGTVVGILGMESSPGVFQVVDIVYPITAPQKPSRTASSKIALISGLHFNGVDSVKHDILSDYLTGAIESTEVSDISRVLIAGDSLSVNEETEVEVDEKNKYGANYKSNFNASSVVQLNNFLNETLRSVPVDIMPGSSDPAETSLPQQPLHKAFFQSSKQYLETDNFRTLTNPVWLQYDELVLLGTSGENINDIYKYIVPDGIKDSRTGMLEATLIWQNIIPTAPDTLWCYPFVDNDPFTLTETPHVYFVGNQPKFETKIAELERGITVKLIAIPKFSETGQFVILDTDTLETKLITIDL